MESLKNKLKFDVLVSHLCFDTERPESCNSCSSFVSCPSDELSSSSSLSSPFSLILRTLTSFWASNAWLWQDPTTSRPTAANDRISRNENNDLFKLKTVTLTARSTRILVTQKAIVSPVSTMF